MHQVVRATPADFGEIAAVWEAAVRATHYFLTEEDILHYKSLLIPVYLPAVNVYCLRNAQHQIMGFLGTADDKVEMLFISPDYRGKKVGASLLRYAIATLGARKVDVNEQNEPAVGFYQHFGFRVIGRSASDGSGKLYPLLHMALSQP